MRLSGWTYLAPFILMALLLAAGTVSANPENPQLVDQAHREGPLGWYPLQNQIACKDNLVEFPSTIPYLGST